MSYMYEIYKDEQILEYLRFNPKWYKILDNNPQLLKVFLSEAKEKLGITVVHKLENLKGQISFMQQLIDIM